MWGESSPMEGVHGRPPAGCPLPSTMALSAMIGLEPCTCVETLVLAGSWVVHLYGLAGVWLPSVNGACGLGPAGVM